MNRHSDYTYKQCIRYHDSFADAEILYPTSNGYWCSISVNIYLLSYISGSKLYWPIPLFFSMITFCGNWSKKNRIEVYIMLDRWFDCNIAIEKPILDKFIRKVLGGFFFLYCTFSFIVPRVESYTFMVLSEIVEAI